VICSVNTSLSNRGSKVEGNNRTLKRGSGTSNTRGEPPRKLSFEGAVRVALSASHWRQKQRMAAKKRREEEEAAAAESVDGLPVELSAQTPPPLPSRYLASSRSGINILKLFARGIIFLTIAISTCLGCHDTETTLFKCTTRFFLSIQ